MCISLLSNLYFQFELLSLTVDSHIQQSIEHFTWTEMCLKLNISKNELSIIIMTHSLPIPPIPHGSPTNLCYLSLSLCATFFSGLLLLQLL